MAAKRPPTGVVGEEQDDELEESDKKNTTLMGDGTQLDINLVSTHQTPLQTQSTIQTINKLLDNESTFHKEHPKAQYDDTTHTLKEGKNLLLHVEVAPPPNRPIQHVGSKPVNTADQREQTISCVMPAPEKLGTNFIQELLKTTGECEVECKTLDAAEKFIKLAGAQADKLSFDYTKAPFDAPGAEDRITKAVEKAMGVVAPQETDEVTIIPKSHL